MGRHFLLSCIGILAFGLSARADIPAPGTKPVSTKARFENLAEYPDYDFWVVTQPFNQDHKKSDKAMPMEGVRLEPGKADMTLSGHYTAGQQTLFAVPKKLAGGADAGPTSDWFDGKRPGILQATLPLGYGRAPFTDLRDEFWHYYRVQISQPGGDQQASMTLLTVSMTAPSPLPGPTHWWIAGGVGLMALAMMLGWLLFIRRKKPAVPQEGGSSEPQGGDSFEPQGGGSQ